MCQVFFACNPRAGATLTCLGHKGKPNLCLLQPDYASHSFTQELPITCPRLLMSTLICSTTTTNQTNGTRPTMATNIAQQLYLYKIHTCHQLLTFIEQCQHINQQMHKRQKHHEHNANPLLHNVQQIGYNGFGWPLPNPILRNTTKDKA